MVEKGPFEIYIAEICRYAMLTPEQELDLAKKIQWGDKVARQSLANANLRLVVNIAEKYAHEE